MQCASLVRSACTKPVTVLNAPVSKGSRWKYYAMSGFRYMFMKLVPRVPRRFFVS